MGKSHETNELPDANGVDVAKEKWCPGEELNHRHADFQKAGTSF